jgi:hypothetical protein
MDGEAPKGEGIAFRPLPLALAAGREQEESKVGGSEPRCEMCGAVVIVSHCKRICLQCGFMTGCSEGI